MDITVNFSVYITLPSIALLLFAFRLIQMLRWLCLLSLSLPVLFWFGHVIRRDDPSPALQSTGLKGYVRIAPGRTNQVRGNAGGPGTLVEPWMYGTPYILPKDLHLHVFPVFRCTRTHRNFLIVCHFPNSSWTCTAASVPWSPARVTCSEQVLEKMSTRSNV